MAEVYSNIERVLEKVEKLGNRVLQAEDAQRVLELEKRGLLQKLDEKNQEIADWKGKFEVLKMAKSLSGTSDNSAGVKLKINELVREIDKCIALLNR